MRVCYKTQILHNINRTLIVKKYSEHCIELESRAQINLTSRKFHVKGRYYKYYTTIQEKHRR